MRSWKLLLLPAATLWAGCVLIPLVFVLRMSLYAPGSLLEVSFYRTGTWTLTNFAQIAGSPYFRQLFGFTALLAACVTVLTVLVGYLLGYTIYRATERSKIVLILLIALPKFTNILVFVFGVKLIFGANGFLPVVAGEVMLLVPYAAFAIAAALEAAAPDRFVEAARGLGASAASAFWHVTLPMSMPGVSTAAILSLLWSASAFLGPYLLGEPAQYTVAVEVERQIHQDLNWPIAAALNVALIAVLGVTAFVWVRIKRRFA
jgi:ABC-type spermidine/putrescine transport system permease subunit I